MFSTEIKREREKKMGGGKRERMCARRRMNKKECSHTFAVDLSRITSNKASVVIGEEREREEKKENEVTTRDLLRMHSE